MVGMIEREHQDSVRRRFEGAYGAFYDSMVSRPAGLRMMGLGFGSQQPAASIGRLVRDAYADAPSEPLLDAPCGALSSLAHADGIERDGEVVGVDLATAMLDRAKRRLMQMEPQYPVRFVQADATDLPFGSGTFGAALSINGLHCIADPTSFVSEVARVLRPEGTFTFTTLVDADNAYSRAANAVFVRASVIPHVPLPVAELDDLLGAAGFEVFEARDGRALVARRCRLR